MLEALLFVVFMNPETSEWSFLNGYNPIPQPSMEVCESRIPEATVAVDMSVSQYDSYVGCIVPTGDRVVDSETMRKQAEENS